MDDDALFDLEIRLLLDAVMLRYRHDFRGYAPSSMRRRMRLAMEHFDCATLTRLQERVLHDPGVFTQMLRLLTVQVSEMFRDPRYFRALREQVLPALAACPSPKVWVAGCGTGEEAWSMAILLDEEGLLERTIVYATDIDPAALRHARAGVYPLARIAQFSRNYLAAGGRGSLSDHYAAAYEGAAFARRLKSRLLFADHSLATDGVFSEVHLVSCRNVLIYFDRPLQDRAVALFHEALAHRGFLGLGARETLQFRANAPAFERIEGGQRLYRKR
jgi:chemotaxis protein methyltransferase CheR